MAEPTLFDLMPQPVLAGAVPATQTDRQALAVIRRETGMLVAWYLMASWLYYHKDQSLLSDPFYDAICRELDRLWDEIDHPHTAIVDRAGLKAGTAYAIPATAYPAIVKGAAERLVRERTG